MQVQTAVSVFRFSFLWKAVSCEGDIVELPLFLMCCSDVKLPTKEQHCDNEWSSPYTYLFNVRIPDHYVTIIASCGE